MVMERRSPYGNIQFAPISEVPVAKEWARDHFHPRKDEPTVTWGGKSYVEFSLWENSWLEDESRWDEEVHAIHRLFEDAAPLDDDFRIMRLQVASYEACHYAFPDSLMKLVASIGTGVADRELKTGCYANLGPNTSDLQRLERISAYAAILGEWAEQIGISISLSLHPDHEEDVHLIHDMLGPWSRPKALYARRLALLVGLIEKVADGYDSYSNHHCYPGAAEIDREIFLTEGVPAELIPEPLDEKSFLEILSRRSNPLLANISSYGPVFCRLNLFRHFHIMISSVGCGEWRGVMPETGENRRNVERFIPSLVCALNGWLAGLHPSVSAQCWPDALEACEEVGNLLGESTPQKRCVVAMLWKRLKNQKGRAAIDGNPQSFRAQWMAPS